MPKQGVQVGLWFVTTPLLSFVISPEAYDNCGTQDFLSDFKLGHVTPELNHRVQVCS